MRTVVGHFRDRVSAGAAYDELRQRGFSEDALSVVERGRDDARAHADDEPVTAGAGAAVGGMAGVLIGVGAMLIPGVGPILAVGPIAAALAGAVTGAVAGAVTGGMAGALVESGVDADAAHYYDELVKVGGVLLTVRADEAQRAVARDVLERHGADLRTPAGARVAGGSTMAESPGASSSTAGVRQSTGTASGAMDDGDYQAHVSDDPGLVDTPYATRTGMTGFDRPDQPLTPPPDPPRAEAAPPAPKRRSGSPPIL